MVVIRTVAICCFLPTILAFTGPHQTATITSLQTLHATSSPVSNDDITQEQYNSLTNWFTNKSPRAYISPKFSIAPSPAGGYGAFASQDVSAGELLLRIPRSVCLTLDDVFNDVECGNQFKKLMEEAGPGSDTVIIAGYLAKEYLLMQEYEMRLKDVLGGSSIDASAQKRFESVKFGPYLRSLPWRVGVNSQDHVLFWEEEDVERLLEGSLAYEDAIEIRNSVKYATKILTGIIGPVVNRARGIEEEEQETDGFRLPWQQPKEKKNIEIVVEGLEEAVKGAFVICLSRGFARTFKGDYTKEEECLVPFLDILQHSNEPNCSDENSAEESNMIEVKASTDIKAGDELFNQYKQEEDVNMPYHKFFTRFGFVPGVVEPMADLIASRSSIFFPKQQVV